MRLFEYRHEDGSTELVVACNLREAMTGAPEGVLVVDA